MITKIFHTLTTGGAAPSESIVISSIAVRLVHFRRKGLVNGLSGRRAFIAQQSHFLDLDHFRLASRSIFVNSGPSNSIDLLAITHGVQ